MMNKFNTLDLPKNYVSVGLILRDCIESTDRLKLIDAGTGELVYVGFAGLAPIGYERLRVKEFCIGKEVWVKDWRERGLRGPSEPGDPDYITDSGLMIRFYKIIKF